MQIVFKIYQFSPTSFCFLYNNGRLFRIIKLQIGIVGAFTPVFFFFLFFVPERIQSLFIFHKESSFTKNRREFLYY